MKVVSKMKKLAIMLVAVGALWIGKTTSHAIPYSDYDNVMAWVTTTHSGTFNIASSDGGFLDVAGFNPNFETIISATASFTFLDSDGDANTVSVFLGGSSTSFLSGPVVASLVSSYGSLEGSALIDLNEDGVITYTISNNNPSDPFLFLQAFLTAEAAPKSIAAVPDGGNTVSLLGLALLGLFGIERCWRKVKASA